MHSKELIGSYNEFKYYRCRSSSGIDLFAYKDRIVAFLRLMKIGNFYRVISVKTDIDYLNQGLAFSLYQIAVLKLGLTLISDTKQTAGGYALWRKMIQDGRIEISAVRENMFDLHLDHYEVFLKGDEIYINNMPFWNTHNIALMAKKV